MKYVNTYLLSVEEIADGSDPSTTESTLLGYLPGHCSPDRRYKEVDLDTLPRVYRRTIEWHMADDGLFYGKRWLHEIEKELSTA